MHQNDPEDFRNFPVHNARAVVAFWAEILHLSSVQIQLEINAQIRNRQSTTGFCVRLLIWCCLWCCLKRTAGITADLDDCVDLVLCCLALPGTPSVQWVWLCFLRVQCLSVESPPPRLAVWVLDSVASVACDVLVACSVTKASWPDLILFMV